MAYTFVTRWSSRFIQVNCPHVCVQGEHEFESPGMRNSSLDSDIRKYICDASGREIIPIFPFEEIIDNSGLCWVKDHDKAIWMTVGNARGNLEGIRDLSVLGIPRTPPPRAIPLGFVSDSEDGDLDDPSSDGSDAEGEGITREIQQHDAANPDIFERQVDDLTSRLAEVTVQPTDPQHDALIRACVNNDREGMHWILSNMVDPTELLLDARGYQGVTALHLAAGLGYQDMVALLTTYDNLLAAKCDEGWTPLLFAFYAQQYRTVIMLLQAGSSLDVLEEDCCSFARLCKQELGASWNLLKYINDNYSAETAYLRDIGRTLFDNIPLLMRAISICERRESSISLAESLHIDPNANDIDELEIIAQLDAIPLDRKWNMSDSHRSRTAACLIRGGCLPPIFAISGWSDIEVANIIKGRPWRDETFELARLIGHHLPPHFCDGTDRPGSFFASHAEKKALTAFIATHTLALERPNFPRGIPKFLELSRCEPPLRMGIEVRIYIRQDNGFDRIPKYCSDCIQFMQQVVNWFGFRVHLHLLRKDGKQSSTEFLKTLVSESDQ